MKETTHLIVDRDNSFLSIRNFLKQNIPTKVVLLARKSPNLNAFRGMWFRSLKSEYLDRMIFFKRISLENPVRESVEHYRVERDHQRIGNELIDPRDSVGAVAGKIECRE